jgi:hypothetical protein
MGLPETQVPGSQAWWTLDEYVLRVELGEDIREVLVEGAADYDLLASTLRRWNLEVTVREAVVVSVARENTMALGLTHGIKGRLLAIAAAFASAPRADTCARRVAVLVDRDYEDELPGAEAFALYTDGFAMENYALTEDALNRFAERVLGRAPRPTNADGENDSRHSCSGEDLYERLIHAAIEMASVRLALLRPPSIKPLGSWLDYAKIDPEGQIALDGAVLLTNLLTSRGQQDRLAESENYRHGALVQARGDPQRWVRGHDFLDLLSKLLRTKWGRQRNGEIATVGTHVDLARHLLFSVDPAKLDEAPLFQRLRSRFA